MFYGSSTHRKFIFITINWRNNLFLQLERRKNIWGDQSGLNVSDAVRATRARHQNKLSDKKVTVAVPLIVYTTRLRNWVTHESERQTVIKLIMLIEPCVAFHSGSFSLLCLQCCTICSFHRLPLVLFCEHWRRKSLSDKIFGEPQTQRKHVLTV